MAIQLNILLKRNLKEAMPDLLSLYFLNADFNRLTYHVGATLIKIIQASAALATLMALPPIIFLISSSE